MILLDQITYCILKTGNPEWLLAMDLDSFDSLHASLKRLDAIEKYTDAYTMAKAFNDPAALEKHTENWVKLIKAVYAQKGNDAKAFMQRVGAKGF